MISAEELLVIVNFTESSGRNISYYNNPLYDSAAAGGVVQGQGYHASAEGTAPQPSGPLCNATMPDPPALDFYLNGLSTAVVVIIGVLGNFLAMIVLTRRTMRSSTNIFLTALAVWDTAVLTVVFLLISLSELSRTFRQEAFPYVVVYLYPVGLAAQTATVWLTVSFTVERYIAVCHPLKAASMCSIPRARTVVLAISAISVLYNVPRWFEYSIVKFTDSLNQTCIAPGRSSLANDSIYHKIYFGWLYFLVMCFIPLCSLAVLNMFLILAVRRSKHERRNMNVKESRENNVTIMLVLVVMVFIVCQVPALIYNMAYSIDMPRVNSSYGWGVFSNFRNFLVTLNSAVNFILYCALGQKFRRTFVRTLLPCVTRRMPGRFQSFSFNRRESKSRPNNHHHTTVVRTNSLHTHAVNGVNGSAYPAIGYHRCRTDQDVAMDLKVLRKPVPPPHSSGSNESDGGVDVSCSNIMMGHRCNSKLLLSSKQKSKMCRAS